MQQEHNEQRHYAVDERHGYILHRHTGDVRHSERDDELEGLQFAYRALAHKAQAHEKTKIDDYRTDKYHKHSVSIPVRNEIMKFGEKR